MGWLRNIIGQGVDTDIEKAKARSPGKPKAWNYNPDDQMYNVASLADTSRSLHPGTIGMDYTALLGVSRVPIIGAIIQTRIQQVSEYTVPQASQYSSGYRIKLRDHEEKMSKAAKKEAREITKMLENAGGAYGMGGFEPSIRALLRDSLVYDQANFEIIRTRGGKVTGFIPVDAMTIRRARPKGKHAAKGRFDGSNTTFEFVQIVNDKIVNEFRHDEMAFCVRRPRTWIDVSRYGYPELEELVRVVTDLLNAQTWNSVNFTNGVNANTILTLKSSMSAEVFTAFKRHVGSMMTGIRHAHRMPIVQLSPEMNEDISAVKLNTNARDMEYTQWLSFLIKLVCAVYCMDPAELGFVFGNENQTNALATGSPQERIISSKERGLRPLLRSLSAWLNKNLIYKYDEDFCLEFVGIDTMGEQERVDLDIKSLKAYRTINEIRAEHDLPALDTDIADMILDPTYINTAMQEKMMEQGPPEGEEGEEGIDGFADEEMQQDPNDPNAEFNSPDLDELTQNLAGATEKAMGDGRILRKGKHTGKRKKAFVRANRTRAYIVEVDD